MDRRNKEKTREQREGGLKEEKQGGKHVREGEREGCCITKHTVWMYLFPELVEQVHLFCSLLFVF